VLRVGVLRVYMLFCVPFCHGNHELNMIHCLQHSFFEHLFNLYFPAADKEICLYVYIIISFTFLTLFGVTECYLPGEGQRKPTSRESCWFASVKFANPILPEESNIMRISRSCPYPALLTALGFRNFSIMLRAVEGVTRRK